MKSIIKVEDAILASHRGLFCVSVPPKLERRCCTLGAQFLRFVLTVFISDQGRNREIFQGGGAKSLFPIFSRRDFSFFPLEISILVDPESFSGFLKAKSKKKKKSPQFFLVLFPLTFLISSFNF